MNLQLQIFKNSGFANLDKAIEIRIQSCNIKFLQGFLNNFGSVVVTSSQNRLVVELRLDSEAIDLQRSPLTARKIEIKLREFGRVQRVTGIGTPIRISEAF